MKDCTCENHSCKLHPANHDKGCTPCIQANLKTRDTPACFFHLLPGAGQRGGDTFEDFAGAVLDAQPDGPF